MISKEKKKSKKKDLQNEMSIEAIDRNKYDITQYQDTQTSSLKKECSEDRIINKNKSPFESKARPIKSPFTTSSSIHQPRSRSPFSVNNSNVHSISRNINTSDKHIKSHTQSKHVISTLYPSAYSGSNNVLKRSKKKNNNDSKVKRDKREVNADERDTTFNLHLDRTNSVEHVG